MVNDGAANTTRQPAEHGGGRRSSTTTSPPSPSPRRPRRVGPPPSTSSAVLPPPSTPVAGSAASASSSSSCVRKQKSVICPICKKDMCHEKALCGHIRWHTQAERQAAYADIAKALASNFISADGEQQPSPKRFKLPDLNQPPPPDDTA